MRDKVKSIFIDKAIGVVFKTEEGKEYGYKYYSDASGAISDVELVELPTKYNPIKKILERKE